MTYCPSCISYGEECSVDSEEWDVECSYYMPREQEVIEAEIIEDETIKED